MIDLLAFLSARLRGVVTLIAIGTILWGSGAFARILPPSQTSSEPLSGLSVDTRSRSGQASLVITSANRFELQINNTGITHWYNLQRDPQRRTNLVAPGTTLLTHELAPGTFVRATPVILEQNPVRIRVAFQAGTPSQPISVEYTIWAGGQIAVMTRSSTALATALQLSPTATTGAALQSLTSERASDGTLRESLLLYLNAWTGEGNTPTHTLSSQSSFSRNNGVLKATVGANTTLRITLPVGIGRQPRFEIANWPDTGLTLRRAGTTLLPDQDYLAYWNPKTKLLVVQYLGLLPPDGDADERSFELSIVPAAQSLSLGVAGRDLDPVSGLLTVDANLPAFDPEGVNTIADTFRIPYIQTNPALTVTAAQTGGAGVEFVVDGNSQTVMGSSVQATFTLPAKGEYRLDGYVVDAAGQRLGATPDDTIATIGYGNLFVSIGDSITAGKNGHLVRPDDTGIGPGPHVYPINSHVESPVESTDLRNIYQLDNYFGPGNSEGAVGDYYYRGYQLRLNNLLADCSDAPAFILNDGLSGSSTAYYPNGDLHPNGLLAKINAYNSHIATLGANYVLLQIGTNDAGSNVGTTTWSTGLGNVIAGLKTPNPGLNIWVARVPWRDDNQTNRDRVIAYNAEVPGIVAAQNTASNPVRLGPDFYSYFEANQGFFLEANGGDDLHPNQDGLDAMATLWSDTICPLIPPGQVPTATHTATTTGTATETTTVTVTTTPTGTPSRSIALPLIVR